LPAHLEPPEIADPSFSQPPVEASRATYCEIVTSGISGKSEKTAKVFQF
jgi:hypothetical protein